MTMRSCCCRLPTSSAPSRMRQSPRRRPRRARRRLRSMTGRGACFDSAVMAAKNCRMGKGAIAPYRPWWWARFGLRSWQVAVDIVALPTYKSSSENIQRGVLQQHDGLGVGDAAVGDHGECFVDGKLEHLDVFAFMRESATETDAHLGLVFADEEMDLLRQGARA